MCTKRERRDSASARLAEFLIVVACGWPFHTVAGEPPTLDGTPTPAIGAAGQFAATRRPAAAEVRPLTTREALLRNVSWLEEGLDRLQSHPDYTATLYRRERIGGTLKDGENVQLKLRHRPFSVHLFWDQTGQEAAYIEGQHDGKLLVLASGWRRRLGRLKFDPRSSLVMRESHYAITETGLQLLAERLLRERRVDLELKTGVSCRVVEDPGPKACDCRRVVVEYDAPQPGHSYRKVVTDIDHTTLLPVAVQYFGWPAPGASAGGPVSDEDTLIGHYVYRDVQFDRGLGDDDFRIIGGRSRAPTRELSEAPE